MLRILGIDSEHTHRCWKIIYLTVLRVANANAIFFKIGNLKEFSLFRLA